MLETNAGNGTVHTYTGTKRGEKFFARLFSSSSFPHKTLNFAVPPNHHHDDDLRFVSPLFVVIRWFLLGLYATANSGAYDAYTFEDHQHSHG
jgi:hypothetical protein